MKASQVLCQFLAIARNFPCSCPEQRDFSKHKPEPLFHQHHRASAYSHTQRCAPCPPSSESTKWGKLISLELKKIISNMLPHTSAQRSSPAKGLGDSSRFQLIYSNRRALLAEQEDWQCIRAPNWKVIKSLSEAGKLRPPANLSACSQLRGTRESNNPLSGYF